MARDTDSKKISEAVRTQPLRNDGTALWKRESFGQTLYNGGSYVTLHTEYDEALEIFYGPKGRIVEARYRHWDNDLKVAHSVQITTPRLATTLKLIETGRIAL